MKEVVIFAFRSHRQETVKVKRKTTRLVMFIKLVYNIV